MTRPRRSWPGSSARLLGVELVINRVEAKAKLSENRRAADVDGVVAGLTARSDADSADAVHAARQPTG